jgi:hypothetical protein
MWSWKEENECSFYLVRLKRGKMGLGNMNPSSLFFILGSV